MRRGRRADAHEDGRNRPSRVHGKRRIAEMASEGTNDLVTEFGERLRGIAGEIAIGKDFYQSRSQRKFPQRSYGADGFSRDRLGRIVKELTQQGIERIREFAEKAR